VPTGRKPERELWRDQGVFDPNPLSVFSWFMPPFQRRDATLRTLSVKAQLLPVVPGSRASPTG